MRYDFWGFIFRGAYFRNFTVSYPAVIDTRRLCTRLRTDGIKKKCYVVSQGANSEVIKLSANTRNRSRVCLFWKTMNEELFILKTIMANYGWK